MKKFIFTFTLLTGIFANAQNERVYIHPEKQSFKEKMLKTAMGILGRKYSIEKKITHQKYSNSPALPQFKTDLVVENLPFLGENYWKITPKNPSGKVIYYIHGGGYLNNITKFHWNLIEQLAQQTGAVVFVPNYPLIPRGTHKEAHAFVDGIYQEILKTYKAENTIFMGDSAGGGLALSFAMSLRNDNRPQPSQLILLSPWLDITMQNKDIEPVRKKDKILDVKGLKMAGELYAKDLDKQHYLVSPIYGDLKGLSPISTFIGTHDIFIADNRKFKTLLEEAGNDYHYFEYPKMFHVWTAVVSLKESKKAISQMVELIKKQD